MNLLRQAVPEGFSVTRPFHRRAQAEMKAPGWADVHELAEDLPRASRFIGLIKEKYQDLRRLMPEDLLPEGVERGSEPHLRFITLVVSIDYMKNADGLWKGAREAFREENWLFDPAAVTGRTDDDVASALGKHRMTRMRGKDGRIWRRISKTLEETWGGKVGNLLNETGHDAVKLYARVRQEGGRLPYLRGHKILPLWLRMLDEEAMVNLEKMDEIPLPVDINVMKATLMLGVLKGRANGGMETIEKLKRDCQEVWKKASKETGYPLVRLDEPLWLLGRDDRSLLTLAHDLLIDRYRDRISVGYDRLSVDT